MAGFDVIDATLYGYRHVWKEREALMRHAAIPLMIKIGSLAAIAFLGLWENFLRQGLILVPAYLAEGFLVAFVVRMVLSNQNMGGEVKEVARPFARDIMASMVIYVLIKLMTSLALGLLLITYPDAGQAVEQQSNEPSLSRFLVGMLSVAGMIWAFRLLWLYVPVALGFSMRAYLMKFRQFTISFYMIACWLFCFFPFFIGMMILQQLLSSVLPDTGTDTGQVTMLVLGSLQAVVELIMVLVSSLAMAYGINALMTGKDLKEE